VEHRSGGTCVFFCAWYIAGAVFFAVFFFGSRREREREREKLGLIVFFFDCKIESSEEEEQPLPVLLLVETANLVQTETKFVVPL
jgi:hypothetical protein